MIVLRALQFLMILAAIMPISCMQISKKMVESAEKGLESKGAEFDCDRSCSADEDCDIGEEDPDLKNVIHLAYCWSTCFNWDWRAVRSS